VCYVCNAKNNAAKNILGFDKIFFVDGEGSGVFDNEIADTLGKNICSIYKLGV